MRTGNDVDPISRSRPSSAEARSRSAAAAIALLALSLAPAPASAQRPSFTELETRLAALESAQALDREAMCEKADADGESFRPKVCDPRCDCFDAGALGAVTSCAETSAGEFAIAASLAPGSCSIDRCVSNGSHSWCISDPPLFCTTDPDCTGVPPETCTDGVCEGIGTLGCTLDSDCSSPVICDSSSFQSGCTQSSDCTIPGEICISSAGGTECVMWCGTDADCVGQPVAIDVANVGEANSAAVASCNASNPATSVVINANDALHCLTEVEAVLGASCAYLCGDGELDPGEGCDDGNTTPGDGCSATCQIEP